MEQKAEYKEIEIAKAKGVSLPISTKVSIEICNHIRNKSTKKAIAILERVLEKKEAIPYKRFNWDVGHKPGKIAAGRYPEKACIQILKLVKQAEKNAGYKGLGEDLVIFKIVPNKASRSYHYGRQRRRLMKRTHIELFVKEINSTKKKETKKSIDKTESKIEEKVEKKSNEQNEKIVQKNEATKKNEIKTEKKKDENNKKQSQEGVN